METIFIAQGLSALRTNLLQGPDSSLLPGLFARAKEYEDRASRINKDELTVVALIRQAEILVLMNDQISALQVLNASKALLGNRRKNDLLITILTLQSDLLIHFEDWNTLYQVSQDAISIIEAHRDQISSPYVLSAFMRSRIRIYSNCMLAAYKLNDYHILLHTAELSKCNSFALRPKQAKSDKLDDLPTEFRKLSVKIDELARAQENTEHLEEKRRRLWEQIVLDKWSTSSSKKTFSLEDVQNMLDRDEAVIYYYWVDTDLLLIVVLEKQALHVDIRLIEGETKKKIEQIANFLLRFSPTSSKGYFQEAMSFISDTVLPDIEAMQMLKNKKRLLISPHRSLHALPFHALTTNGQYLIEQFAVTYIPNLSSLLFQYAPKPERSFLGVGTIEYEVPGGPCLSPLTHAESEIHNLIETYQELGYKAKELVGKDANESKLRALEMSGELKEYSCLHFSLHGANMHEGKEDLHVNYPMEAHLFMRDSTLDGLEISQLQHEADLVVMSACCSGHRPIAGRDMPETSRR